MKPKLRLFWVMKGKSWTKNGLEQGINYDSGLTVTQRFFEKLYLKRMGRGRVDIGAGTLGRLGGYLSVSSGVRSHRGFRCFGRP